MIDKERRKKLAMHLRHLSGGLISNDDFESNIMDDVSDGWLPEQYHRSKKAKFDDAIIIPMLELCWMFYSDLENHKLTGKYQLSKQSLEVISRSILFLHSDNEYQWPFFDMKNPLFTLSIKDIIISIFTFGQHYRNIKSKKEQSYIEYRKLGDYEYWPFFKKSDYIAQLNIRPFLDPQHK